MEHFRKGLRTVAIYEASKGVTVIIGGLGLLRFLNHDLREAGEKFIRYFHLNPASHYPQIFLEALGSVHRENLLWLAAGAVAYSLIRFLEAYGLWTEKTWAEWMAILSTLLYIPVEIYEMVRKFSEFKLVIFLFNFALLIYLLWVRRQVVLSKSRK